MEGTPKRFLPFFCGCRPPILGYLLNSRQSVLTLTARVTVIKKLVEMMEGTIGVESSPGVRSIFWIELALARTPSMP